jgi:hypothetical protein
MSEDADRFFMWVMLTSLIEQHRATPGGLMSRRAMVAVLLWIVFVLVACCVGFAIFLNVAA